MPSKSQKIPRLRLRITATAETIIRAGHPWLFAESVREQNREGAAGEIAVIFDRNDRFLAAGLFDPHSPIRLRMLQVGKPRAIAAEFWRARLEAALALRRDCFDAQTTGWRVINGESDGFPGLVLDRYDSTYVLKIYTAAWLPWLEEITGLFRAALPVERMVLRLSRNIQATAQQNFSRGDGAMLVGTPLAGPVVFLENGLRFEADVVRGQKTGFFLDQRENRRHVEMLARNRDVLNAFSFSGGFSLYAARGGAASVTNLDLSPHALAGVERNFRLNESVAAVSRCERHAIQADAFEWLEADDKAAKKFGLVILDPPSLAKRESEREGAIRAYEKLAFQGIGRLERQGILVAASCSAHVTAEEFFEAVRRAGAKSGRKFQERQRTGHAPDHPARFKEMEYLKAIYLELA
jgi:23S rRNA (cytosine1962-C5)-methyltransferase